MDSNQQLHPEHQCEAVQLWHCRIRFPEDSRKPDVTRSSCFPPCLPDERQQGGRDPHQDEHVGQKHQLSQSYGPLRRVGPTKVIDGSHRCGITNTGQKLFLHIWWTHVKMIPKDVLQSLAFKGTSYLRIKSIFTSGCLCWFLMWVAAFRGVVGGKLCQNIPERIQRKARSWWREHTGLFLMNPFRLWLVSPNYLVHFFFFKEATSQYRHNSSNTFVKCQDR